MNPVILTGMHRSGTSAITRLTQSMGFDVGSNLLPATENNLHGHFEEMAFIHFHDRMIRRFFPERAPFCEWLPLSDAAIDHTGTDRAEAMAIWGSHRSAGGAAWKDPRTSLFLDLWTEVLPDAKIIICLRHPYQVHLSLLRRGEPFLHADYGAAIRGWAVYNQRIARTLAKLPKDRFLVVDVESAFRDSRRLAERLARFLAIPLPDDSFRMIAANEFHFSDTLDHALHHFPEYFPEACAIHDALQNWAAEAAPWTARGPSSAVSSILSPEARLIEFEEAHGLRARAREMLVRSIEADRRRLTELFELSQKAHAEKDLLIDDLSRFNEQLKHEILRQRAMLKPGPAA